MKSPPRNRPAVCLLLSVVLLALVPAVLATSGVINVFAPFGSIETFPASINNHGAITGWHIDGSLFPSGFVRDDDGTITSFDASAPNAPPNTRPFSINDQGAITGYWVDSLARAPRGFVREEDGTVIRFDPTSSNYAVPVSINNQGAITGYCLDASRPGFRGFVRDPYGVIAVFQVPNASNTYVSG